MTKLEIAARQVIEAEQTGIISVWNISGQQAITAMREALAEPDIEEMTLTQIAARHEQVEQEPVSISDLRAEHHKAMLAYDIAIKYGLYERNAFKLCDEMKKLYAAPVSIHSESETDSSSSSMRTTVRTKYLTDSEIAELWVEGSTLIEFARAVIAADREKNK